MPNDWGGLSLGGVGSVNVRGATPPIGNTGPGGGTGMGLMALLRRLSMGLDERETELPEPMSPDPASERSMAMMLGLPGASEADRAAMAPGTSPMMGDVGPTERDMMATGQEMMMPLEQVLAQMPPGGMPPGPPVLMSKPMMPMPGMGAPPQMAGMPPGMPPGGMPAPTGMPPGGMGGGGTPPVTQMTPEMMRQIYDQEMARLNGTGAGY